MARTKLDQAYARSAEHYMKYGEAGLMEAIRANLAEAAADVRRYAPTASSKLAVGGRSDGRARALQAASPRPSPQREREDPHKGRRLICSCRRICCWRRSSSSCRS